MLEHGHLLPGQAGLAGFQVEPSQQVARFIGVGIERDALLKRFQSLCPFPLATVGRSQIVVQLSLAHLFPLKPEQMHHRLFRLSHSYQRLAQKKPGRVMIGVVLQLGSEVLNGIAVPALPKVNPSDAVVNRGVA